MVPGAPAADAPLTGGTPHWLLRRLPRDGFAALLFDGPDTVALRREI